MELEEVLWGDRKKLIGIIESLSIMLMFIGVISLYNWDMFNSWFKALYIVMILIGMLVIYKVNTKKKKEKLLNNENTIHSTKQS